MNLAPLYAAKTERVADACGVVSSMAPNTTRLRRHHGDRTPRTADTGSSESGDAVAAVMSNDGFAFETSEGVIVADQIDRSVLPLRRPVFGGVVNRTLAGSRPDWNILSSPRAPEGAPNVLLVLIDDAGFGNPSTFGGPIQTPNLHAAGGRRACATTAFHVTALCSPTRAALLTGRNHHSVGFGSVGELSGGLPGLLGVLAEGLAPFPRILQENGYSTAAFGKWHLTPDHQQGPAGPFDRWPNGWGFDYFWGFLGGEAGQYDPLIYREPDDRSAPPERRRESSTCPTRWPTRRSSGCTGYGRRTPDKPWFVYYSHRLRHAPHHVAAGVERQVQGPRSTRAGTPTASETFARQKAARRDPRRRRAHPARRGVPGLGLASPTAAAAAATRARWRSSPASWRTPTTTSAG